MSTGARRVGAGPPFSRMAAAAADINFCFLDQFQQEGEVWVTDACTQGRVDRHSEWPLDADDQGHGFAIAHDHHAAAALCLFDVTAEIRFPV